MKYNMIDDYNVYHNLQDYLLSRRYSIILNKYPHKELRRFYKDTIILLNYISSNNDRIHVGYE